MKSVMQASARDILMVTTLWALLSVLVAINARPEEYFGYTLVALNRGLFVFITAFVLWPLLGSTGRIVLFVILSTALLILTGLIDETVLEPLFLPERAKYGHKLVLKELTSYLGETLVVAVPPLLTKLALDSSAARERSTELMRQKTVSELAALKSQFHPHILFNTLNNIYGFAQEKSDKAPQMISRLSELLRYMVYGAEGNRVPLDEDLAALEHYITLQEMGLEGRGRVNFTVEGETNGYIIAPLLMLPLVENAFKHSMDHLASNIVIDVTITMINAHLNLRVTNRCPETEPRKNGSNCGGVGLQNLRRQLSALYPDQHVFETRRDGNHFTAVLDLDLEETER